MALDVTRSQALIEELTQLLDEASKKSNVAVTYKGGKKSGVEATYTPPRAKKSAAVKRIAAKKSEKASAKPAKKASKKSAGKAKEKKQVLARIAKKKDAATAPAKSKPASQKPKSSGGGGGTNSKWHPFKNHADRGEGPKGKSDHQTDKYKCRCSPAGDNLNCACRYKKADGSYGVKKVKVSKKYKREYNHIYKPGYSHAAKRWVGSKKK